MPELSPEASQWLKDHRHCVLATGRKDGSPQQSFVGYQFDGSQFLMGGQSTTFKMQNLRRQPRSSLMITDGRGYVLVYGRADLVSDPAEMEKLQARFGPRGGRAGGGQAGAAPARHTGERVNILFTPDKYMTSRMNG